jgi:hypothetical protein
MPYNDMLYPQHLKCCISFRMLQCLSRFRVGWHHLRVQTGRQVSARQGLRREARAERLCPLCSVPGASFRVSDSGEFDSPEDLLHFVSECPAYNHIRRRYHYVFAKANAGPVVDYMRNVFACDNQAQLAACLYTMDMFRNECLKLPVGAVVRVAELTGVVEQDIELIRMNLGSSSQ